MTIRTLQARYAVLAIVLATLLIDEPARGGWSTITVASVLNVVAFTSLSRE